MPIARRSSEENSIWMLLAVMHGQISSNSMWMWTKFKAKGGRVLVLDPHYTRKDLEMAKQACEDPADKVTTK